MHGYLYLVVWVGTTSVDLFDQLGGNVMVWMSLPEAGFENLIPNLTKLEA
jgi:hypothetical protein